MASDVGQKEAITLSSILKADLFSNLLPKERKFVADRTGSMLLRQGGLLFEPGRQAEHLYLLLEGTIRVYKKREDGGDSEIARFAPGDLIGDFDFSRGAQYDAYAEALEDSSLVMFPGFGFGLDNIALEAPHIVSKIYLNSAAIVTGRIKSTRKLIIESMSWVQDLHRKLHEDPGTGLWKQSFISEEINRFVEDPMALIMLKPDRFKILVDNNGHDAGDKAMIKIATLLKSVTRRLGRGWALRFKSNETGILVNKCDAALAENLANSLFTAVSELPPVKLNNSAGEYGFSGSIVWGIWPADNNDWDSFLDGIYKLLLETWSSGGNKVVHYHWEGS